MKRKFLILLLGCTPFLIGRIQDWLMMNLLGVPLMLISVLMLLFWGYLSHVSLRMSNYDWKALLLLNAPAAIDLLLVLIQEWGFGAYWMNRIGGYSQRFYLPHLSLGFQLTPWAHSVPPAYIAAFLLMTAASVFVYKTNKA